MSGLPLSASARYHFFREVTMIELTREQASVLKDGHPVRVFVPELDGEVVVVLTAQGESTESVLQEMLDDIREQAARSAIDRRAVRKARAEGIPPPKQTGSNGPTASAEAGPAKAKRPRRPRKGTKVNAETAKVLRDADAGKGLLDYPSLEAMFEDLGI
jgi:hypothetical protein